MKFYLVSLGCAKNLVDSESILYELCADKENTCVRDEKDADIIIINTCCFIGDAKEESVNTILEFIEKKKKHRFRILVGGCLPQRYGDEIILLLPEVDGWFGVDQYRRLPAIIGRILEGERVRELEPPPPVFSEYRGRISVTPPHWAYVKIAEGCDHRCSFCIIPAIKGSYRSRALQSILDEIRSLAARGCREINLIAQDTSLYGLDLYGRKSLAELLLRIHDIPGLAWIRVLYLYPNSIDDDLIEVIASSPRIAKYLDIPLQHCSRRILKAMGRWGGREEYGLLIEKLRRHIPGLALRTTFLLGFPGETARDFEELSGFIEEVGFNRAGFFAYSKEEGSGAFSFKRQVSEAIRNKRLSLVASLQKKVSLRLNRERLGTEIPVMIDRIKEPGEVWKGISGLLGNFYGRTIREQEIAGQGRSSWDAPEIDGQVLIRKGSKRLPALTPGEIVQVKVTDVSSYDLIGEIA